MFRIDRIAVWIFIIVFAVMMPLWPVFGFVDELAAVALLSLAMLDTILNPSSRRRYIPLWIMVGIMIFYAVYSMTAVRYNTKTAIIIDILIEIKPFIGLFVLLGIRPTFNGRDKTILRFIAAANVIVCFLILLGPKSLIDTVFLHISIGGIFIFLSTVIFLIASIRKDGTLSGRSKAAIVLFGAMGLLCGRSKYYAEFLFLLFFIFIYQPGMLRRLTMKHIFVISAFVILIGAVTWQKFSYYFLFGNQGMESFDPEALASFARPVLYATSFLIFTEHFPFGTGLASFASYKSVDPYSGVYAEYGIDKVYGLTPAEPRFACDAYYPSLAQFGIVGVGLFIWMITYIIRLTGLLTRIGGKEYKMLYAGGMLAILFVLIESTTGTAIVNIGGVMSMLIIGYAAGRAKELSLTHPSES